MTGEHSDGFAFRQHGVRLVAGERVIEERLRVEVLRSGVSRRVLVVCSPSAGKSGALDRIRVALDGQVVAVVDDVAREPEWERTRAAVAIARDADVDAIVAVGGGGALVAARAVAVLLAEQGDPLALMTRYPDDGGPPVPVRLTAPKPPIVNIPVTPTTAMDRGGAALVNRELPHRMEFFDPKTRPTAILWDFELIRATPERVVTDTAAGLLVRSLGDVADGDGGPLDRADRDAAARLILRGLRDRAGLPARLELMAAAFLQTRIEDARGSLRPRSVYAGDYAAATALHQRYAEVSQGRATAAVLAAALRARPVSDLAESRRVAEALGIDHAGLGAAEAFDVCTARISDLLSGLGMPSRLRELGIPPADLTAVADLMLRNINHHRAASSTGERRRAALALLEDAW